MTRLYLAVSVTYLTWRERAPCQVGTSPSHLHRLKRNGYLLACLEARFWEESGRGAQREVARGHRLRVDTDSGRLARGRRCMCVLCGGGRGDWHCRGSVMLLGPRPMSYSWSHEVRIRGQSVLDRRKVRCMGSYNGFDFVIGRIEEAWRNDIYSKLLKLLKYGERVRVCLIWRVSDCGCYQHQLMEGRTWSPKQRWSIMS